MVDKKEKAREPAGSRASRIQASRRDLSGQTHGEPTGQDRLKQEQQGQLAGRRTMKGPR
jgi:hypothetical protein